MINGKSLPWLGTYGQSYYNDLIKRQHILDNFSEVKYFVFWNRDLTAKDFRIK